MPPLAATLTPALPAGLALPGLAVILEPLVILLGLLVLGAHVLVPLRAASLEGAGLRQTWGLLGALGLGTLVALTTGRLLVHPDPFLGAELLPAGGSKFTMAAVLMAGLLLLVDLVLARGREQVERAGWWIAAGLGALGLGTWMAIEELARIGAGPPMTYGAFLGATLCRMAVALAAGQALLPTPSPDATPATTNRGWRARLLGDKVPTWPLLAAAACAVYAVLLPDRLLALLAGSGDLLTLGAAAALFALAPWAPGTFRRYRRVALLLAVLLMALFLARAGTLSQALGEGAAGSGAAAAPAGSVN